MTKLRQMAVWGPALVFIAAMLWASDAPFRLHLTQSLSSKFIVLGEHFFDCLVAVPILFFCWKDIRNFSWREWLAVLFVGIGGSALGSVFFTQAFHYVNPSVAILLQKVQPLIAILLAWTVLGEKLHPRFWVWCMLALFGAYLVSFPNLVPQTYSVKSLTQMQKEPSSRFLLQHSGALRGFSANMCCAKLRFKR